MLKRFRALLLSLAAVAVLTGGCFSHSQDKKTAATRWEKMSARMKLAVAKQQFDSGKYADAAKTVSECLKADPNAPQAHVLAGKIDFVQGQAALAVAELEKALKFDEKLDEGWYWLGLVSEEQGQSAKALECYQKALDLNGSSIEYILAVARASVALNKADEALALLNDKMGMFPSDVELKAKCADLLCRSQKYDEAIVLYRQTTMLAPDRDDITEAFGHCCILAGQWNDASDVFTKLIASCTDESKKAAYLQLLGICQINGGKYGGAISSYSKLNLKDRDNPQTWLRMGQAALGAGDADRAYACGMHALALQPGYKDAIAVKGSAEYLKKNYNEAIKSFEQIVGDPAHEAFAWMMLAKCYGHTGDTDKAEHAAQKARMLSTNVKSDISAKLDK